jgi:hypothetical protein
MRFTRRETTVIRISIAATSFALLATITPSLAADYDSNGYGAPRQYSSYGSYGRPTYGGYSTRYSSRYSTRVTYDDDGYAVTQRGVVRWGYDDGQRSFHRSWHCDD